MERYGGTARGGRSIYGFSLGILMLDTDFPRIPGDIGNALTWDFPVLYKVVKGASVARVVEDGDPALITPFINGAQELIVQGAKAITTSCGFLAVFQREIAEALSVPIFTSALLMVPLVYSMLPASCKVGIMTFNSGALTKRHFKGAGIENIPMVVCGMENSEYFARPIRENLCELDVRVRVPIISPRRAGCAGKILTYALSFLNVPICRLTPKISALRRGCQSLI